MPSKEAATRLQRVLRQPTAKCARRDWTPSEGEFDSERDCISLSALQTLVSSLDETEVAAAAAGSDPGIASDAALAKRRERFGDAVPAVGPSGPSAEEIEKRKARFGIANPVAQLTNADKEAMEARSKRFGNTNLTVSAAVTASTAVPVDDETLKARQAKFGKPGLTPEQQAAMEARASRFGSA